MLRAGVENHRAGCDRADEHVAVGFLAEDAVLKICAGRGQGRRIGVVVESGEVGLDVFPAAVVVDGAGWVEGSSALNWLKVKMGRIDNNILGQVVDGTNVISLRDVIFQRSVSPAFVERSPGHNAGVVDVSLDSLDPFAVIPGYILVAELVSVCDLSPDQKPKPIGPVVEDGVFDLLVLAASVDAHLQRHFDVGSQRILRRRRETSLRPVTLVENEGLENGFIVQSEGVVSSLPGDTAHSGGGVDLVELSALRVA